MVAPWKASPWKSIFSYKRAFSQDTLRQEGTALNNRCIDGVSGSNLNVYLGILKFGITKAGPNFGTTDWGNEIAAQPSEPGCTTTAHHPPQCIFTTNSNMWDWKARK
jgi:hypothetical protein